MNCDQFNELFDLYAVGALEKPESDELRLHLDTGCNQCGPKFVRALMEAAEISGTVPLVDPPNSLRTRIVASFTRSPGGAGSVVSIDQKRRRPSLVPWLIAAASLAALALGLGYEESLVRKQAEVMATSQAEAKAELDSASKAAAARTAGMLSILQAPGTRQVAFNINESNLPHGSLFIHSEMGVTMVVAHLPSAPAGLKYESWIVPKSGAPIPVESFATDKNGLAFTVVKGPVDISKWAAMAVSLEPAASNPVKPTKVVFASPV